MDASVPSVTIGLIGSTGFVGGTVARQRKVDLGVHRPDVQRIRGRSFARLWVAGAPAQKWVANADPDGDAEALRVLAGHLEHVVADEVVLISSVDVYPVPVGVDEDTALRVEDHEEAYGRNRLWLEQAVRSMFPAAVVMRLPGLFGTGLRKNLVYDLLHGREQFAHQDSTFQFYDMTRLCDDADTACTAGLRVVNLATEPLAAHTVAERVFACELREGPGTAVRYDMQTRHASVFGREGSRYVEDAQGVLDAMSDYVAAERTAP